MPPGEPMRLGVNAGSARGMGSSFVCKSILRALSQLEAVDLTVVATPDDWVPAEIFPNTFPEIIAVRRGVPGKLMAENLRLRRCLKRERVQALLSLTDTTLPRVGLPHLLLIQQAHLAYPLAYLRPLIPARHWPRFLAMDAYLRAGKRSVSVIVAQSNSMRRRLAERLGFPEERIIVIPSAVDVPKSLLASWPGDTSSSRPYVLYPAHGDRYKNHAALVDAMQVVKAHGMDLTCALTLGQQDVPDLVERARKGGILDRFEFLGRLARPSMLKMARYAAAVLVPSQLESFPLVLWEAMGIGCPIIASDLDFAREACEDAATYCNPLSGSEFGQAMVAVLENASHAERLSSAAKIRFESRHRDWDSIAREYESVIRTL